MLVAVDGTMKRQKRKPCECDDDELDESDDEWETKLSTLRPHCCDRQKVDRNPNLDVQFLLKFGFVANSHSLTS
jgi:hypothetical protein